MSSSTGTAGEPQWGNDAPSLAATFNELSAFAVKRGNMLKGTTAERTAFSSAGYAKEGDQFRDTTLKTTFVYQSSTWVDVASDTGWQTLTPAAGWSIDPSHPIEARRLNGVVYLRGRVNGPLTSSTVLTLPVGFRPSLLSFFLIERGSATAISRITVDTTGAVVQTSTNAAAAGANMGLSGITFPVA